jgi:two-component system LytT family response regulator
MKLIRTVLIDDEAHCIKTLLHLLAETGAGVDIVGTANNGKEGIAIIREQQPDLVFLDIQMPYLNGLDMLEELGTTSSQIIFTTAFDQFAIRAIKLNALDYLLKPVDRQELADAIAKYCKTPQTVSKQQLRSMQAIQAGKVPEIIAISSNAGLEFLNIRDIILLEGDSCYTNIYLTGGAKRVISKTLHHFEELLEGNYFFRAHKSYLVNLREVKQYLRGENGELILSNNRRIAISRNKKEAFLDLFAGI